MKLTKNTKRAKGMTLLELTVVILVLLSLITILFIGARAWKKGSDRAGCIMNIRNVQQAARSYQNMYNLAIGDDVPAGKLQGADQFLETAPVCPGGGTYSPADLTAAVAIPAIGTPVLSCTLSATQDHVPSDTTGW
ncbi:hypothetical protein HAHE_30310 [Haloferula helveola]|uniref:Prepilin-type N-terminal cleavage/methylation domain-containing protein n=1 Tax=Haloferula helveola TaxID=490095 RepID=A0ABN6H7J2_9BACT|nr:hypothetical protein HAHE_30310 [Haloferula helveola]